MPILARQENGDDALAVAGYLDECSPCRRCGRRWYVSVVSGTARLYPSSVIRAEVISTVEIGLP